MVLKPNLTNFGDSFGEYGGKKITDTNLSSEHVDTGALGNNLFQDVVEFSPFEQVIHDFIMARLGHPIIRVELSAFQIKTAIDEAISKFFYHIPMWSKQFAVFDASAGVNLYELPPYIIHGLEYVVYKKSLLSIQAQAGTLEFDFFIKYFQDNHLFSDFSVGEFYLLQQHLEEMRKILSQEGSWDVIDNRYLQLAPTPVTTPQPVIIEYRAINSNTIHPAYRSWIQRYALACSKGILGLTRGKFAVLPSPTGGAHLDGEALRQESVTEKEKLEIELLDEIEEPPTFTLY